MQGQTMQLRRCCYEAGKHGTPNVVRDSVKPIKSLPLTSVNGASRLALCVKDLASRAHLRLSASSGGGRVQSIGGAVQSRGGGGHMERSVVCADKLPCGSSLDLGLWEQERSAGGKGNGLRGESSAGHSMRRAARGVRQR
jgi:hypothetical protein